MTVTRRVVPIISVDDIAHASARRCGLEIVHDLQDEAWGVRRFFFRDASSNVINVLSHRGQIGGAGVERQP